MKKYIDLKRSNTNDKKIGNAGMVVKTKNGGKGNEQISILRKIWIDLKYIYPDKKYYERSDIQMS